MGTDLGLEWPLAQRRQPPDDACSNSSVSITHNRASKPLCQVYGHIAEDLL